MSIYRGPFTSLDLNQGVWLDVERDDFGNAKCWMTVDGEEIELTENQYDALMKGRAEAYRAVADAERERFVRIIEREIEKLQGMPNNQLFAEKIVMLLNLIARVREEQK